MSTPTSPSTTSSFYSTTDFYLSAYLQALGYNLVKLEMGERNRATFIFADVPREAVLSYYHKDERSLVPALDFVYAIKRTREMLYNVPR